MYIYICIYIYVYIYTYIYIYSCTYGLYPFFITLKGSDIQILFEQGTFAFRKGQIACIEIEIINIEKNIIKGSCL